MMEKEQLRRADFVTSIILIVFSLWMLAATLQMPMRDTFGGVTNVWYVSPALMPLFISVSICALGIVLLIHSIRVGGARQFLDRFKAREQTLPESTVRFLAILLALITFVYVDIPRIDFFVTLILFLFYFISAFYFEDDRLLHKATIFYLVGHVVLLLFFVTGVAGVLQSMFLYSMDVIALAFFVALMIYVRRQIADTELARKRYRITVWVTFLVPIILTPVFRYALRVPLPEEGGIIELMNLIYYSLR
ncbi:MAG: hypothetical protein ACLFPV_11355 [Spirochaetaceae bacterium]